MIFSISLEMGDRSEMGRCEDPLCGSLFGLGFPYLWDDIAIEGKVVDFGQVV